MADKGRKGQAPAAERPPEGEEITKKPRSVQPKDNVGTRKGCRRYMWELKDSNREFWVMGNAEVKILSLGCLIAALVLFTGTSVHPLLMLIVTMELSLFCCFFIIYTLAINRYITSILWPVSDLLNDLFAFIFLVGAVVIAVKSRRTMPLHYFIAVILTGMAGTFALFDLCLQRKHFKDKTIKKNVLVPPPKKEEMIENPKEEETPPERTPEKEEKLKEKKKRGKK